MSVILIIKNISIRVYLTNFIIKSGFFFSMLFHVYVNFITVIINSFIITIINIFVTKNLKISSLLPLLLVFLFFLLLLILLYLFVIVSYSQCCYSYQVNITIVSFVNFLIYTFFLSYFFLRDFVPVSSE